MVSSCRKYGISERKACAALDIPRSVQRYIPTRPNDEVALQEDIICLASKYGRYGYRRITALLRADGWRVNHKRVERIWREEGLKVPKNNRRKDAYILMMARAYGSNRHIKTMSGATILSAIAWQMTRKSVCLRSLMNLPASVLL